MAAMTAIEAHDLHKSYGAVQALRGIDFRVAAGGGIVGLLGPNGAGKTTLLEILEGLRRPSSGLVRVLGLDPVAAPAAVRARIGVQLQTTAFVPELSVSETLRLYSAFYPRCRPAVEVLREVQLDQKVSRTVSTLSRGEQQRLALAMAMLHDPELLILDEPTSGLDPVARRQIHSVLERLRRAGKTVLLSSHHLDEVESLANRVVILAHGRIVADGSPLDLLGRSAGASTLWLAVSGDVDATRLVPGAVHEGADGAFQRYRTGDPTRALVGLADALRASGARLHDIRLKRPSLEDVYLELIGESGTRPAATPEPLVPTGV
jgi:ABC-2 type transport system ATP-binding protein